MRDAPSRPNEEIAEAHGLAAERISKLKRGKYTFNQLLSTCQQAHKDLRLVRRIGKREVTLEDRVGLLAKELGVELKHVAKNGVELWWHTFSTDPKQMSDLARVARAVAKAFGRPEWYKWEKVGDGTPVRLDLAYPNCKVSISVMPGPARKLIPDKAMSIYVTRREAGCSQ